MACAALLLHGCAAHTADRRATSAPITVRPGRPGVVVAALPGDGDLHTDEIAVEIARRTGFGLVVAPGPWAETAGLDAVWERRVHEAAGGAVRFYAEIHGDGRTRCAGRIEIATVGVDRELALRLRALAGLIRDAHLRAHRQVERLDVRVEPADTLARADSRVGHPGTLRLTEHALHIELPGCASRDFRQTYSAVLADFLAEAVALASSR